MDEVETNSRAYFLWNNSRGTRVGAKNAEISVPVASLTKMMTTLLILENAETTDMVEVTPEMLGGLEEFAVVGLKVGQKVSVEDLLYATMLPSAGDAAQALAIYLDGTIARFVERMNQRAAEMGLTETHFGNPVGMDEDNYATPEDMAKLVAEATKNAEFLKIFESFEKELPTIGKTVRKTFPKIQYLKGGKSGFTNAAGRCLASTAKVEGTEYILVTVGADLGQNVADAAKIYQKIAEDYEPVRLLRTGEKILSIPVEGSPTKEVEFEAKREVTEALPNGVEADQLEYIYKGATEITQKTETGELGVYEIRYGEETLYTQAIHYDGGVEFYNYAWMAASGMIDVTLVAGIVMAVAEIRQKKVARNGRQKKFWKILAVVLTAILTMNIGVGMFTFAGWFGESGEMEIYRPEIEKVATKVPGEPDEEKPTEEEPETSPGQSTSGQPVDRETENCTLGDGNLMLINPNFVVDTEFITSRWRQLISVSKTYGIPEYHAAGNGDNIMMPEAASHLAEMVAAYKQAYPGHEIGTYSCFRARGTSCGRLCAATGTSDHHTGLTCDLIDLAYGDTLNTDYYPNHKEWQWLRENSYKYGFIDRFPAEWAGGPMSEPLNVDANGSTGLFETWHYRYVGVEAATEIATGKYNNGRYDSLEHYLKATGRIQDLKNAKCQ